MRARSRRGLRRPRREDVFAASVVLLLAVCLGAVAGVFYIATQFKSEGSLFGRPTRIPACGRSYLGPGRTWSRAEIDAAIAPGFEPVVLEPTIGQIPLLQDGHPTQSGSPVGFCATVVFLHVGADRYVGYALEGGP